MLNKKQLFCFTYAGGTASFFEDLDTDLSDIDVIKLEYSGHGIRHREALYNDFGELADDMYNALKDNYSQGEYSLFGYSMGTISVVEILSRIIDKCEIPQPTNVFLAAHEPITKEFSIDYNSDEADAWVKERTIRFGTVPDKLLDNKSFWRMYLPLYKADYSIIGKYRFEDLKLKSFIPATIFYSETDTKLEDMKLWNNYFVGKCDYYLFKGSHFFIRDHHKRIADIIKICMNGEQVYDI